MSMDFETVRFLRVVFAAIFGVVGGAAGIKYGSLLLGSAGGLLGPIIGILIGGVIGWNAVDLVKGRPHK